VVQAASPDATVITIPLRKQVVYGAAAIQVMLLAVKKVPTKQLRRLRAVGWAA
jgi:hypothetical protein